MVLKWFSCLFIVKFLILDFILVLSNSFLPKMRKLVEKANFMHYSFINTDVIFPPSDFEATSHFLEEKETPVFVCQAIWTPLPDTIRHFLHSSEEDSSAEIPQSSQQWPDTVRHFWHSGCQSFDSTPSLVMDEEDATRHVEDYEARGVCHLKDQQQIHLHRAGNSERAENDVREYTNQEGAFTRELERQHQQQQEEAQQQSLKAINESSPLIDPENSIINRDEKKEKEFDNTFESNHDDEMSGAPAKLKQKPIYGVVAKKAVEAVEDFAHGDESQTTSSESDAEYIAEEPAVISNDALPCESAKRCVKRDERRFRITKLPLPVAQRKSDATLYRSFYMPDAVGKAPKPTANGSWRLSEKMLTAADFEQMMVYFLN